MYTSLRALTLTPIPALELYGGFQEVGYMTSVSLTAVWGGLRFGSRAEVMVRVSLAKPFAEAEIFLKTFECLKEVAYLLLSPYFANCVFVICLLLN